VRVAHADGDRQRQEFLGADGQVADVVLEDGATRWHYMPRSRAVFVMPMDKERNLEERIALLKKNYKFQVMGQARQAGRVVLLTQFTPLHKGNPSHRLWVDLETRLPLVVERRTADGKLIDRSEYVQIAYGARFDKASFKFTVPPGTRVESPMTILAHGDGTAALPRELAFHPAPPREVPEGYQLQGWQYFLSNTRVPTFNWRYHDGLNTLSLFATAERQAAKLPMSARVVPLGASNASLLEQEEGRLLAWSAKGVAYTLVGHLPADDLVTVARSTL
jgi:outer membrane lipoprotein-sorting protein